MIESHVNNCLHQIVCLTYAYYLSGVCATEHQCWSKGFLYRSPGLVACPHNNLLSHGKIEKHTGWANKKQANFKLPPFKKFFILFL